MKRTVALSQADIIELVREKFNLSGSTEVTIKTSSESVGYGIFEREKFVFKGVSFEEEV